ncbi:MAG: Eco57I restriction-modification methylase domain-containing protein, partial [Candidatus Heimdallarchaeaceae archaeon]
IYAPIALQTDKFDIIVGNPPWIALRYIENKDYQDFIKKEVFNYKLLDSSDVKLFTHMEMATLFFMKTADLYLRDDGVIAFVMPRSVLTGAKHHQKFQEFKKPQMKLLKILDFEDVSPLFNVPSAVLIAKKGEKTEYPVTSIRYRGKLPKKNMKLGEAIKYFDNKEEKYSPPKIGGKKSYYYDKFLEGATLVPRNFWFVEFEINRELGGVNPKTPTVRTSREIIKTAKPPWKDIILKGGVENEFLYWTVLGGDIYPFSFTPRLVVLPVQPKRNGYRVLDVEDLRNEGYPKMARWLEKTQEHWEKYATEKSKENVPRIIQWIDYRRKLGSQNPNAKYYVLYNGSGKHLASCVISKNDSVTFDVGKIQFRIPFFIAESKSYYYSTNNEDEAHYISAILNSDVVNNLIKDLQTKGSFGERDIHRRPLELPIPKFDPNNEIHIQLAELSKRAHEKMRNFKFKAKSAGRRRKEAGEFLKEDIEKINELVRKILEI